MIDPLAAPPEARTVTIVAPPGYGKTTLMSMWKAHESRPTGWLTVDWYDNDPAILHANIVVALQHAGMLSGEPTDDALYISRHTVQTQAMSIYRKLGSSSRSEAVHLATEAGFLTTRFSAGRSL